MKIDQTDRAIISLLQDDARQSNAAIARVIGVSEATIRRRIKMMVDDGIVAIQAVPNPTKFGLNTTAMIGIDVQPDHLDAVAEALNARQEVGFLGVSTGRYDLLVWTLVESLDAADSPQLLPALAELGLGLEEFQQANHRAYEWVHGFATEGTGG